MTNSKGNVLIILVVLIAMCVAGYFYLGKDKVMMLWDVVSGGSAETSDVTPGNNLPPNNVPPLEGKDNLIQVTAPLKNTVITSPLTISGQARGMWYFEASFPVKLLDADGKDVPLNPGHMMAAGDWMTENFVPFTGSFTFTAPASDTGTLILMKDNPSGLPENEDSISIPVRFR